MYKVFLLKLIVTFLLLQTPAIGAESGPLRLLVFGDSLSAAYGMEVEQGWVHLLANHWRDAKLGHQITNASISGETTDGGLGRLSLSLQEIKPDVVMIELGGNDGLRGHPLPRIQSNVEKMVETVQQFGALPIVVGISLPPSLGPRYVDGFRQIFPLVAASKGVLFVDFYRADFYSQAGYMQSDGLHPTALPQPIIRDSILDFFSENELFQ